MRAKRHPGGSARCAHLRDLLEAHARRAVPREACGLVLGSPGDSSARVHRVVAARNAAREPGRFELDPLELLAAERDAEARGLVVLGTWHSHVEAPAVPSQADRAGAHGLCWILSLREGRASELRAWRILGPAACVEVAFVYEPEDAESS